MTPEARARERIDQKLAAAGWVVPEGLKRAIRQCALGAHGH